MTGRRQPDRASSERPRICKAIARARSQAGWSQERLAEKLNVSQGSVARWERSREPALAMIGEIESVLGLRRGELLRRAGFVGEAPSVEQAIEADPGLVPLTREVLLAAYRSAVSR